METIFLCERYNSFGKSLSEMCCTFGIHMFNGRIPGDLNGEFTCTANEGTSIVDYMLASTEFFQYVSHFSVEERDESVHFPCYTSFLR